MSGICYSLPEDSQFARRLARELGAAQGEIEVHRFPDGETRIRLGDDCAGSRVMFIGGQRDPNRWALPFLFAAHAARAMGARDIGLVAPYLAYMRQDAVFRPGESVSAQAYARFLSNSFDWVGTVDPHLHRLRSLEEVFTVPAFCVSSMPAIAQWIAANVADPVLIGPDSESSQWVEKVARALGAPWAAMTKHRGGDRQVTVSLAGTDILRDRSPVIIDDIASSGRTLAQAATTLLGLGSRPVTCVVVHALLAEDAEAALRSGGVTRFASTNTIAHSSNQIDVVPLLAARLREHLSSSGLLPTTG